MRAQDAEEIVGSDDLAVTLIEIILHEGEESFIANAFTDLFKEVCALEVCGIGIRAEALTFIDGDIYKAFGFVEVDAV